MDKKDARSCIAFEGSRRIASGDIATVAKTVKECMDRGETDPILIFDDVTSEPVEVDFRGAMKDVLKRLEKPAGTVKADAPAADLESGMQRGPGRPKLGVIAREVTLLPRHWDWLNSQPGGASVALRKLVEDARRVNRDKDRKRYAQEAAYRFMSAMAGNLPGFEEASRALFAGNPDRFEECMVSWPVDIREHARKVSQSAFPNP